MANPVDHDFASGTATVVGGAAKGLVGGILTFGALGALVAGGLAALAGMTSLLAPALIGGAVAAVAGAAYGATIGGVVGATSGALKVKRENEKFKEVAHSQEHNVAATMQQAQQQAYFAGVQDGQQNVVNKLQEVQAQQAQLAQAAYHPADDQKANFADRFQKKSVAPETIAQQREAAAHAAPHVG